MPSNVQIPLAPSRSLPGSGSAFGNEFTASPRNTLPPTGSGSTDGGVRRKQTLLSILEALQELQSGDMGGPAGAGGPKLGLSTEDDIHSDPTQSNAVQSEGAEGFEQFDKRIKALDKGLRDFANATRQLGSSVGILNSAVQLHRNLFQILHVFHENAAELFPQKVKRTPKEHEISHTHKRHHQFRTLMKAKTRDKAGANAHFSAIHANVHELVPEDIPRLFRELAGELQNFLERLNEFPEFTDEAVNTSFLSFEGDLQYWASTLAEFKGQFKYPSVGRYVHDLASEMGEHLDNITTSLAFFVEVGVPTIRFVQKHGITNLLNLSYVSTFFSAVTATTLQFSYQATGTPLKDAVNTFWFCSLVFSIASAVNSLLGLTWKQAMYRSPGHRVPWWVLIWIKRSPLIFLVISVAAFSIGLVLFSWSSGQSRVTSIITSVFTCLSSFGLIAVSLWFAFERWAYSRHKGQRWLADVLSETAKDVKTKTGIEWVMEATPRHVGRATRRASDMVRRFSFNGVGSSRLSAGCESEDGNGIGMAPTLPFSTADLPPQPILNTNGNGLHRKETSESSLWFGSGGGGNDQVASPDIEKTSLPGPILEEPSSTSGSPTQTSPKSAIQQKWARAARAALMSQSFTPQVSPVLPLTMRKRQTTSLSVPSLGDGLGIRQNSMESYPEQHHERMNRLVLGLRDLRVTHEVPVHQALVRHLQFSDDGKWLATCSWDRTSHLFKAFPDAENPCTHHKRLPHPSGGGGQVAWSPDGSYLLTKLTQSIKVWSASEGLCKNTIRRDRIVQSVAWMPMREGKDPAFMSVEAGGAVCMIDLQGTVLHTYSLERLSLYDVVVTPDAQRFLGVASLLESKDQLKPIKSRPENRIIVYNLEERAIESQVPVLNEVRDITLGGKDGCFALVSYQNLAPPQLWNLQMVRDRTDNESRDIRLVLSHTYMPQKPVLWAGASYFGGKEDQLVLCAGKGGDVHIWDRASGRLLHSFQTQDQSGGDLTAIAWNPLSSGTLMLATGTHDGILKIWTSTVPAREDTEPFGDGGGDGVSSRASSPEPMIPSDDRIESPAAHEKDFQAQLSIPETDNPPGPGSASSSIHEVATKEKKPLATRLGNQISRLSFNKKPPPGPSSPV